MTILRPMNTPRASSGFVHLRTTSLMGLACAAILIAGCGGGFEKVSEGDVDADQKATAQAIGTRLWEGCRTGQHAPLTEDEAIKEMREALTPAKLASTCSSVKGQFGDYQSMDYAETWKAKSGALRVYRFRGHFSNSSATPEIRVVMDGKKLSGFWLKPWADTLR